MSAKFGTAGTFPPGRQLAVPMKTNVNRDSETFKKNVAENTKMCDTLQERLTALAVEGKESDRARHKKRGQLTARERVEMLIDQGSPFLDLFPFAGYGNKKTPRTGLCGIGLVSGIECMIIADVPTVRGGARNEAAVNSGIRALQMSIENKLPLINLTQTAGADLTQQHKVFHKGGETFRLLAERARAKIPTVTIVFGSSTAGGAYQPGMSDYIIMVKDQAKVYLGGPPLVKMATGETVSHEELGGAKMHSTVSGVSDYLARDESHAVRIAREIVSTFPVPDKPSLPPAARFGTFDDPAYPEEELLGIISPSVRDPFDISEVIARITDGSRVNFFKSNYGKTLVCCWASVFGVEVGIIGNNGVLLPDSTNKGTQFIHLCNQKNTPIIFLHNITGFMVGKQSEQQGLIKYGALLVNAVSNSQVPHVSVIVGASFGAGNYAMCGRAYKPRFMFTLPTGRCSVMGAEQLSGVMDAITKERLMKMSGGDIKSVPQEMLDEAAERKQKFQDLVEKQMDPYFTSGMLLDDGIIDPRDLRTVLGLCLNVIYNTEVKGGNVAGVSRL